MQVMVIISVPLAGDEAYFVAWGKQLSWIYYDHPPLTGWLSWLLNQLSSTGYLHRGFSVLLGLLNSLLFFRFLLLRYGSDHAQQFTPLFLSIPITILLFSLFVNDSLLFSALTLFYTSSFLSLHYSANESRLSWLYALVAGIGLGLAVLVKFTALVYFTAAVMTLMLTPRYYRFLFGQYFLVGLVGFAFFLLTLVPNYFNCGINLAFNFVFREGSSNISGLWELLGSLVLLLGPMLFFWRPLEVIRQFSSEQYFFSRCFIVTTILLAFIAINRGQFGLHWAAPVAMLGLLSTAEQLGKQRSGILLRWNLGYSLLLVMPLATIFLLLTQASSLVSNYFDEDFNYRVDQINDIKNGSIIAEVKQKFPGALIVSDSYGVVSMIEMYGDERATLMFNDKSKYGRNHDIFRDYRDYDGMNVVMLSTEFDDDGDFAEYAVAFQQSSEVTINGRQGSYRVLFGEGFSFQRYRDNYIVNTLENLYDNIPTVYGACYMDRYRG